LLPQQPANLNNMTLETSAFVSAGADADASLLGPEADRHMDQARGMMEFNIS
jgi:hypothetical protein